MFKLSEQQKKMIFWLCRSLLIALVFTSLVFYFAKEEELDVVLSRVASFVTIFSIIFIGLGVIIAYWQYTFESCRARTQQAVSLAGYFKDTILEDVAHIISINRDIGIMDILDKNLRLEQMKEFDMEEMESLLGDNYDLINKKIESKDFLDVLAKSSFLYGFAEECQTDRKITSSEDKKIISVSFDLLSLRRKYAQIVLRTLNALEYFAMHFTHNTADETVVYQSLHQSYLQITQCLYYEIANKNKNMIGEGKYYSNLVELFHIWRDRTLEKRKKDIERTRVTSKGTVVY